MPCVGTVEVAAREKEWEVRETCLRMGVMGKVAEEQEEHSFLVKALSFESSQQNRNL